MKANSSNIELVTYGYPTISLGRSLDTAAAGERHMESGYEELVGGRHIKDALAGGNGLVLVVVDVDVPVGPLDRGHIVDTGVGPDQQTLALALDVKGHHTDGVSGGIHRADTRYHFVARLNEDRPVGEWLADLHEQLSVEFTRLADALAASPEVELCHPEHVA